MQLLTQLCRKSSMRDAAATNKTRSLSPGLLFMMGESCQLLTNQNTCQDCDWQTD